MLFLIVNVTLLIFIILLLLLLSAVWPPDSPWAPWWQMPPAVIKEMCKSAKMNRKSIVYELGSGTGKGVIICAKDFEATVTGVEIDVLRYWISRWNVLISRKSKKVTLLRKNFFQVPLHDATILLLYLTPKALERLTSKFLHELQPGTILLSYKYEVPLALFKNRLKLMKHDATQEYFVYKMNK